MSRNYGRPNVILVGLLVLPFYFQFGGRLTNLSVLAMRTPPELGQAVHFSVFVPLIVGIHLLVREAPSTPFIMRHLPPAAPALLSFGVANMTIGLVYAYARGVESVAVDRYFQVLIVTSPLLMAPRLRLDPTRVSRLLLVMTTAGLLLIEAYTLVRSGADGITVGGRLSLAQAFPQLLIYLPFLTIVSIVGALTLTDLPKGLRAVSLSSAALFFLINWSRSAVVLAVLSLLLVGYLSPGRSTRGRASSPIGRLIGAAVGAAGIIYLSTQGTLGQRQSGLSSGRSEIAADAVDRTLSAPLTGFGFIPRSVLDTRPVDTHNQFLEYLSRSGLIGGVCWILAVALIGRALVIKSRQRGPLQRAHAFAAVIFLAATIGGFSNPYLTQPFPGILVWFIAGVALSHSTTHSAQPVHSDDHNRRPAPITDQ